MKSSVDQLCQLVGARHVVQDRAAMAPYLEDWRGRYHGRALAVVRPGTTAEVAAVIRLCARQGLAVVPQGGNTGLCGGATAADEHAIVLSLMRMRRIRALDVGNDSLTVEAGCTLAQVQEAAAAAGRLFPLALASQGSCTIGGNLSTNAGGVQVLRYGNMRELVLGLEVVLPDGRVWDGLRGLRKDNSGYDLKQLFIGAEGTLGVITAAVLKLYPAVRQRATAWASVPDPAAAVRLLSLLRSQCTTGPSAFEIIGDAAFELVLAHLPDARAPLAGSHRWQVLIELSATNTAQALDSELAQALEQARTEGLITDAVLATSLQQAADLWALREHVSAAQRRHGFSIKHDISLPLSAIATFLEQAEPRLRQRWPDLRIVAFGHIGDGNLHYNLSRPAAHNDAFIARSTEATRVVHDLVHAQGGSIAAEHGLGQLKRAEIKRYKSAVELDMMRSIKRAFDPAGRMNPGKVLD